MGVYKVIQDIEAEDKLFGPLTLKQFIFACVAAVCFYLSFWAVMNELLFLLVVFLPPGVFFGFLAFPWSSDQPTEVWMMAKLRFLFRPRKRIWDQAGIKELVTITVPKKEQKHYTDGLSNREVKSRLRALADTIDTRGWAVKNVNVNLSAQPGFAAAGSDRLVALSSTQQIAPDYDVKADDDIYDERFSSTAQHFNQLIEQSSQSHRQQLVQRLQPNQQSSNQKSATPAAPANDYWFMRQPAAPAQKNTSTFQAAPIVTPGQSTTNNQPTNQQPSLDEQKVLEQIHAQQQRPNPMNSHLKTILPLDQQQAAATTTNNYSNDESDEDQAQKSQKEDESKKADIVNLARNNDLSVETIARQAKKSDDSSDEVVVSLH